MDAFLADAGHLLDVARAASDVHPAEILVLRHRDGSLHISHASGLPGSAVLNASGLAAVYRITRQSGHVRVEGKAGLRSCLLEAGPACAAFARTSTMVEDGLKEASARQSAMLGWPAYGATPPYAREILGPGVGPCVPTT